MDARTLVVVAFAGCSGSDAAPDATVPDAAPEMVPPAGVVAWFKLNESGIDSSGNQFHMLTGGPFATFFGEGYHGGGAYMDGTRQYGLVRATDTVDRKLDFEGAFTVAMWVRPEQAPTDFAVVASRSYGTGTDSSFALVIDSTLRLRYDSQGNTSLTGATRLVLGQWAFVALTFDGSTKRVFLDGVLDAIGSAAVPVTWDHAYLFFGADEGPSEYVAAHHLKGSLDDVILFDRALDPAEIAALAAQ